MKRLVAKRYPFNDESIGGYFIRLCEANAIPTSSWLTRELSTMSSIPLKRVNDVLANKLALTSLESLAVVPEGVLQEMGYERLEKGTECLLQNGFFNWPLRSLAIEKHQVCPDCLQESGYHRKAWSFWHVPICTDHKRTLIDHCPCCDKPISGARTIVCYCHHCGFDYRQAQGESVSEAIVDFAIRMQQPQIIALGTPEFTEPATPDDLFRIWCLAHLPRPGEPLSVRHAFQADKIPLERRLETLALLSEAWIEKRLDSSRLRGILCRRWQHLNAIPSKDIKLQQLQNACQAARLDRDITHILLFDKMAHPVSDAIAQFGYQPPQLFTRDAVAQHLEIPLAALAPLMGYGGILRDPIEGEGFDADELLAARYFLDSMLTADDVDSAVGVQGAVPQLEYRNLLKPCKGLEDVADRYPSEALVDLFNMLFERFSKSGEHRSVVSLQEALSSLSTPDNIIRAIALILNGGLNLQGWTYPYRLVDILIDPSDIETYKLRSVG